MFGIRRSFSIYVDRNGRSCKIYNAREGLNLWLFNAFYYIRERYWRIAQYIREKKRKYFKTNLTGTYVMRNGKSVRISKSARVPDIWIGKYNMSYFSKLSEKRFYKKVEAEGKLHEVDDLAYAKSLFKD